MVVQLYTFYIDYTVHGIVYTIAHPINFSKNVLHRKYAINLFNNEIDI